MTLTDDPHDTYVKYHEREHNGMLREVAATALALDAKVRDSARSLETRLKEIADLHWVNHRIEHESDQRAIDKVERSMVDKFESVNEFRDQQKDIIAGFLPRKEFDGVVKAIHDRLDRGQLAISDGITRAEFTTRTNAVDDRLKNLETFRDQSSGRDRGSAPYLAVILGVIGSVVGAVILHLLFAAPAVVK